MVDQLEEVENLRIKDFVVKHFSHSINVYLAGSNVCVQIQTDERYADVLTSDRYAVGFDG